jgi:hypothetical protein
MTTPNLLPVAACHPSLSSRPDRTRHRAGFRPASFELVVAEQQLQISGNPVALLPPQQRMAGHSPALELRGHLQHHTVKLAALRGGPPLPATGTAPARDCRVKNLSALLLPDAERPRRRYLDWHREKVFVA